jgi:hypothetical protein
MLWSFAVEWNHSVRVIGFFGEEDATKLSVESLVSDPMLVLPTKERYREEVPLRCSEDDLFECIPH